MSALSQSLVFTPAGSVGNTSTVAVVYPNTATNTLVYVSDKVKGDGYYGSSDGLHTVMYSISASFIGTVTMQATLAVEPTEVDWFSVANTSVSYSDLVDRSSTAVNLANFTGNFVWVRGQIHIDRGSVFSIQYNH